MKEHNIPLPLEAQGTTDENSRFDKGLEKQVALFGEGMAKRQTEGPVLRRNINRWLADNLFRGLLHQRRSERPGAGDDHFLLYPGSGRL